MWGLIAIWVSGIIGIAIMENQDDDPTPETETGDDMSGAPETPTGPDTDPDTDPDPDPDADPDTDPDTGDIMDFVLTDDGDLAGTAEDDSLTLDQIEDPDQINRILGLDGNDQIDLSRDADATDDPLDLTVQGGAGDDMIITTGQSAVSVAGGEGNDQITAGGALPIAGSEAQILGGAGDDQILYDVTTYLGSDLDPGLQSAEGGAGADLFTLRLDEGGAQVGDATDGIINRFVSQDEDGNLRILAFELPDFEPGTDTLSIQAGTQNEDYALGDIALTELADDLTQLSLFYEGSNLPTREVVISIAASGLSLEDIELLDEEGAPFDFFLTNQADTVDDTSDAEDLPDILYLRGGDDVVTDSANPGWTPDRIEAGTGNDTVTTLTGDVQLFGDAGDDQLSGIASSRLFGGDGADTLAVDLTYALNTTVGDMDGGDGDDRLTVLAQLETDPPEPDHSATRMFGGDGADTFQVTLLAPESDSDQGVLRGVDIRDFDPTEDTLAVEYMDGGATLIDRTEIREDAETGETLVDLIGEDDAGDEILLTTLSLGRVSGVTAENVVILS